jgi:uncharacterized membrane protein
VASRRAPGRSRTISILTRVEIAASAERVWPFLVDWERLDRWMLEASDVEVVGSRREGVGVEALATIRIAGITTRDPIRVTRWEPPRILEIEHLGWVRGTGSIELSPGEAGTVMVWREEYVPPWGILGRLGMLAVRGRLRGIFRRDADELRRLVEEQGTGS